MKRGETQRRRRNRGRKADADAGDTPAEVAQTPVQEEQQAVVGQAELAASIETVALPATDAVDIVATQAELPLEAASEPAASTPQAPVAEAPAAAEVVATSAPAKAEPAPAPAAAEPVDTSGLNAQGRALNDPRVSARPVGEVAITTSHPALFGDYVAPAVVPSGRIALRASNDPRGPAMMPEHAYAEASGQS
jgi:hypothetical protein